MSSKYPRVAARLEIRWQSVNQRTGVGKTCEMCTLHYVNVVQLLSHSSAVHMERQFILTQVI
jgi:hypothetical protein